jgi:hypothetical protein
MSQRKQVTKVSYKNSYEDKHGWNEYKYSETVECLYADKKKKRWNRSKPVTATKFKRA